MINVKFIVWFEKSAKYSNLLKIKPQIAVGSVMIISFGMMLNFNVKISKNIVFMCVKYKKITARIAPA